MATTTIYLKYPINQSVQIGDKVYYTSTSTMTGGSNFPNWDIASPSNITAIGNITAINDIVENPTPDDGIDDNDYVTLVELIVDVSDDFEDVPIGSYVFFSKDRRANESSVLGYYSEMIFLNNSKQKAELFAAGCEVVASS